MINNLLSEVKYLWLFCKNHKLLIKDKYFKNVWNSKLELVLIKPAYSDESCWSHFNLRDAYSYLKGMIAASNSIAMSRL